MEYPEQQPFHWDSDTEVDAILALYEDEDQLALQENLNQKEEWL